MKNAYQKPEAVKISFELADTIMTQGPGNGGFEFGSFFDTDPRGIDEGSSVFE